MAEEVQYRVTAEASSAIAAFEKLNAEFGASYTTIGQLKDRMSDVRKEIDKTAITAPERIKALQDEYSKLSTTVGKFTESAKLSNTVIDQSGRLAQRTRLLNNELAFTIQDGAYAFNDLRMGVLGISNNLPRVAYQMKELAIQTGSWGTAIKTAALGLFSFNGIMSLAVGGLVAWTALSSRTKKGNNDLGESYDELKKSVEEFNATLKQLNAEELRSRPILADMAVKTYAMKTVTDLYGDAAEKLGGSILKQYILSLLGLSIALDSATDAQRRLKEELNVDEYTKYEQQIIAIVKATEKFNATGLKSFVKGQGFTVGEIQVAIKSLQEAQKGLVFDSPSYRANVSGIKELNALLNPSKKPKIIKHLDEIAEAIKKINAIPPDRFALYFSNPNAVRPPSVDKSKTVGGVKRVGSLTPYEDAMINMRISESEIRDMFPIESTLVGAFEGSIADAGRQAFESIFGQANSLLEIFIQNVVASFAGLAAQDLAGGLLNILTGGATGGASGILDFLGLSKSSQSQQIVVELDGERLAVAMVKSGTSQRVNQLNTSMRRN